MEQTGYFERIKEIRTHFGMNKTAFAAHTKVLRSALSEFESGHREPTREFIKTLSDMGISIDWFLSGTGSMLKPTNCLNDEKLLHEKANKLTSPPSPDTADPDTIRKDHGGIPLVFEGDKELADGIVIPLLENAASAGYGAGLEDDDVPARYIRVPRFLAKYPHLASLPVKGDSMEPTLHDGDLVVCDGGGWDGDGIYVIKTYESAFIKRVLLTSKGYQVLSDNKMYPAYTESIGEMSIVGKVRAILAMVPGRRGGV